MLLLYTKCPVSLILTFFTDGQGDIFPCNIPKPCEAGKIYGDPENCTHYYHCGSGGNHVFKRQCSDGLNFDTRRSVCVWPNDNPVCQPPCPTTEVYTSTVTAVSSGHVIFIRTFIR